MGWHAAEYLIGDLFMKYKLLGLDVSIVYKIVGFGCIVSPLNALKLHHCSGGSILIFK